MGQIEEHRTVLLIAAITSRYPAAIDWAIEKAAAEWGAVSLQSEVFDFTETTFYTQSMGESLKKQLVAFQLFDPTKLADTKIASNAWEAEYNQSHNHPEDRPLNIDPGYLTEAKLILATTKDRDHRIYLRDGIYAEITLYYHSNNWTKSRWTYPDYQRKDFHQFFTQCRDHLRKLYRNSD